MRRFNDSLPFTPLHRHELRNVLRLAVHRKAIDAQRRQLAFADIESDLDDGILAHMAISWTDAFRAAENFGARFTEEIGLRAVDLLHLGIAQTLKARDFLTFDTRQSQLAKSAGFKVKP